mmetsp:Transcript_15059/g.35279  ORF Transcript_15059/g.35279 Transcript_15059/m.35279 type:complete len:166 (+) Transcript_15059:71-568(+)|eukprot:CAMPEP_0171105454 /NCGR_PEP_ID=MMETSP0766_2-20121228/62735_1 /TAXON_ID=439317 /ORGANISM="Gambierdiscus australes, Strain CAWD 149" /LENGTH=165 /DNA_ID=CAMNT_0011566311 /DNA_START=71 /DNA_END=568 /DNA_ORIENTATION=-
MVSAQPEHLPLSFQAPSVYPELKDLNLRTLVSIDVRTLDARFSGKKALPEDPRYVETVYVDGENGPMVLTWHGEWKYLQHDFRCDFAKRNQLALFSKRWSAMSSSEKETWLHLTAKRNWRMRGMLPEDHQEYRDRGALEVERKAAVAELNSLAKKKPAKPTVIFA